MKFLITLLFTITVFVGQSQIKRVTGKLFEGEAIVSTITTDDELKLSYVANSSVIQEFRNNKLVDNLAVSKVEFFSDKIFYAVTNSLGLSFGVTYTFKDRSLFFSTVDGDFTEVHGEGLSFTHQY